MSSINTEDLKNKKLFIILLVLVLIVVVYGVIFKYLGVDSSDKKMHFIKLLLLGLFTFLILVNGLKYFFNFELVDKVEEEENNEKSQEKKQPNMDDSRLLFNNRVTNDELSNSRAGGNKEVFHIGDNIYTYNEAKMICNAYDGDLADYTQLENAYKSGAEWCSYGWAKGQMALYPTQKLTYEKLKKIPGLENSCGRPGINGGYIKNPKVRFGVNCFASKGSPSTKERQEMKFNSEIKLPKTENSKKLDFYKRNINKIVKKPFNRNKWSFF